MDADITIRHERPAEYRHVESIIRQAFYNLYIPGCVEHYLAHVMRSHADFIPELDFVAERNGAVIGSIMYTKASLISEDGAAVPAARSDRCASRRNVSAADTAPRLSSTHCAALQNSAMRQS